MRLEGRVTVATPLADAWDRINDREVLERCAPDIGSLGVAGDDHAEGRLGLSEIEGCLHGSLDFVERRPPDWLHLRVQGKGAAGFVDADVEIHLAETDEGTEFRYIADMRVGGQVERLGGSVVSGLTRQLAGRFFESFERWESDTKDAELARIPRGAFPRQVWQRLLRFLGLSKSI
jgi:carbon monoxide dehydrogenase subunit G